MLSTIVFFMRWGLGKLNVGNKNENSNAIKNLLILFQGFRTIEGVGLQILTGLSFKLEKTSQDLRNS